MQYVRLPRDPGLFARTVLLTAIQWLVRSRVPRSRTVRALLREAFVPVPREVYEELFGWWHHRLHNDQAREIRYHQEWVPTWFRRPLWVVRGLLNRRPVATAHQVSEIPDGLARIGQVTLDWDVPSEASMPRPRYWVRLEVRDTHRGRWLVAGYYESRETAELGDPLYRWYAVEVALGSRAQDAYVALAHGRFCRRLKWRPAWALRLWHLSKPSRFRTRAEIEGAMVPPQDAPVPEPPAVGSRFEESFLDFGPDIPYRV